MNSTDRVGDQVLHKCCVFTRVAATVVFGAAIALLRLGLFMAAQGMRAMTMIGKSDLLGASAIAKEPLLKPKYLSTRHQKEGEHSQGLAQEKGHRPLLVFLRPIMFKFFFRRSLRPDCCAFAARILRPGKMKLHLAVVFMPYSAVVYKVFIASPSDVRMERDIAREVIREWNSGHSESTGVVLMDISWETHSRPETGAHPQAIINQQLLNQSDLLVAIFWTKLGNKTEFYESGTVEELEEHTKAGKPAMIYFSEVPAPVNGVDLEQLRALREFKKQKQPAALYSVYGDTGEFRAAFTRHLTGVLNDQRIFPRQSRRDNSFSEAIIGEDEEFLLLQADSEELSMIFVMRSGMAVTTVKSIFCQISLREFARWNAAVESLLLARLIEPSVRSSPGTEVYDLTKAGYAAAESLRKAGKIVTIPLTPVKS